MDDKNILTMSKEDFMRTKIVTSLWELLRVNSLQRITVTSICKQAGIPRSSFYNLFEDVNDVLDWEFNRFFAVAALKYPLQQGWRQNLEKQYIDTMEHMRSEAYAFQKIGRGMSTEDRNSLFWRTRRRRTNMFLDIIEQLTGEPADDGCKFEVEFFVLGESSVFSTWMPTMKEKPAALAENLVGCIPNHLSSVFDELFVLKAE